MKKTITIAALALAVLACHRKTVPAADKSTTVKASPQPDAHADMVAQGKNVYTASCGRCHGLKPVENYTSDRWTNILKSMIPKARLNDAEAAQVTAYVMANAKK